MSRRVLALLVCVIGVSGLPAHGNELGLAAPSQVALGSSGQLVLNGHGRRLYAWTVIYGVALYLPTRSSSLDYIMDPSTPVILRIEIVSNLMPKKMPEDLSRSVLHEIGDDVLGHVRRSYDGLTSGDVVFVTYVPGGGTTISINGQQTLSHPGRSLMDVFLGYWLGANAVSDPLRADLLLGNTMSQR